MTASSNTNVESLAHKSLGDSHGKSESRRRKTIFTACLVFESSSDLVCLDNLN